jgi:radical SAM protein with 4Fe4S-binding SPASM domain
VSHRGEVYPSGFLPRSAGSVRETSLPELYREAPLMRALRDADSLTGACGGCPYRQMCGGSRSRAYVVTGDPLASDPLCPFATGNGETVPTDGQVDLFGPKTTRLCDCHSSSLSIAVRATARTSSSGSFSASSASSGIVSSASM